MLDRNDQASPGPPCHFGREFCLVGSRPSWCCFAVRFNSVVRLVQSNGLVQRIVRGLFCPRPCAWSGPRAAGAACRGWLFNPVWGPAPNLNAERRWLKACTVSSIPGAICHRCERQVCGGRQWRTCVKERSTCAWWTLYPLGCVCHMKPMALFGPRGWRCLDILALVCSFSRLA